MLALADQMPAVEMDEVDGMRDGGVMHGKTWPGDEDVGG